MKVGTRLLSAILWSYHLWQSWIFILDVMANFGRSAKKVVRYLEQFWYYHPHKFCYWLSLVHDFEWINHLFFYKNQSLSYILKEPLLGIGVWVFAVKNFGSRHHAFVPKVHASLSTQPENTHWFFRVIPLGSHGYP
jgi:hypothetical protein